MTEIQHRSDTEAEFLRNPSAADREARRQELQCRIFPLGALEAYTYTVICTTYEGKWVLSRHRNRCTWETQGGHIEDGETPLACAKRELFEESGIRDADLYPVCDYLGYDTKGSANGIVFLAVARAIGTLPESEMGEIRLFDTLPAELTYPGVSPKLYAEAGKYLFERKAETMKDYWKEDEYWKAHIHRKLEEDIWLDDYRSDLPPPGKALDLGCGIGQFTRRLIAYGYSVVSADISEIALSEVRKFHSDTVKLDMRQPLPFADGTFCLVFANLSIHYFSDAQTKALIAEILRVLVPGGVFIGSVNGIQGVDYIKDTAEELEHHYYRNTDRYLRFFDEEDLRMYLAPFAACHVEAGETVRFGNKKNYLVFIGRK